MPELFGKNQTYKATNIVTADEMSLIVGDGVDQLASGEFLVQNVSIQYNQPLNRLFEIGTSFVYFAPGRAIGSLQMGRIVGRKSLQSILGPVGSGIWTADLSRGGPGSRTLTFRNRGGGLAGGGLPITYIVTGAVVESYGLATDANGLLVQENVAMQFAGLELIEEQQLTPVFI